MQFCKSNTYLAIRIFHSLCQCIRQRVQILPHRSIWTHIQWENKATGESSCDWIINLLQSQKVTVMRRGKCHFGPSAPFWSKPEVLDIHQPLKSFPSIKCFTWFWQGLRLLQYFTVEHKKAQKENKSHHCFHNWVWKSPSYSPDTGLEDMMHSVLFS